MPRWVVVQYDLEMEEWYHRVFNSMVDAQQGMLNWIEEELECMELAYEFLIEDSGILMILDERGKQFGTMWQTKATLDPGYRQSLEWNLFYVE